MRRPAHHRSRRLVGRDRGMHPSQALGLHPLRGEDPAVQDSGCPRAGTGIRAAVRSASAHRSDVCAACSSRRSTCIQVTKSSANVSQYGLPVSLATVSGLLSMSQRLIRVAEQPAAHGRETMAGHARIIAVERRHEAVLVRVVEGDALLQMLARGGELAEAEKESTRAGCGRRGTPADPVCAAPSAGSALRVHGPSARRRARSGTGTALRVPARAAGSPPSAGTARAPARRCARPPAPRSPWSSAAARRGRPAMPARAGRGRANPAASSAASGLCREARPLRAVPAGASRCPPLAPDTRSRAHGPVRARSASPVPRRVSFTRALRLALPIRRCGDAGVRAAPPPPARTAPADTARGGTRSARSTVPSASTSVPRARRNCSRLASPSHQLLDALCRAPPSAAATAAVENSRPATLAASSRRRSSGVSRPNCFSIICRKLSGTPAARSSTGAANCHCARGFDQHALAQPIVHHVDHEQRVSLGTAVNGPPELGRQLLPRKPAARYCADFDVGEEPQRQLLALPMHAQFLLDRLQRMPARR